MEKFNGEMKIKRLKILNIFIFFLILNVGFCGKSFSQATGSLFMLQENFHSQMLNPSYMRNDKALVVSVPILAGATVGNSGNFKISDLILKDRSGNMVIDFEHFYNAGNLESSISDWSSIPVFFVGIPFSGGRLSIYLKEHVQSSLSFNINALEFFNIGNSSVNFRSYNTDNIDYSGMGYRELAVGYARNINEKISIGIRGKLLLGAAFAEVENWSYGINTTEGGDEIELTNKGTGRISLPVRLQLNAENRVINVSSENVMGEYLGSFHNPGLGIDLGATINLNKKSWISVSATDFGGIWFRHNAMNIEQDASYTFKGFDISNSIDGNKANGYIEPFYLMKGTLDSIRNVYRPIVDSSNFVQGLVPKTSLHYQYNFTDKISVGVTNQSAFYKKSILNVFTISTLQRLGNFSVFENVNLYGLNTFTFGGGIQWEGRFGQMFASTDNPFAVYHPARNKSFSMTVGISLIFNKPADKKSPDGKFSPYFPFYDNRK